MGFPFQGNQGLPGLQFGDDIARLFMPPYSRNTDQISSGSPQNVLSDNLVDSANVIDDPPLWGGLSTNLNNSNPFPGGDNMPNASSSVATLYDPSGSSTNPWNPSLGSSQNQNMATISTAPSTHANTGLNLNIPKRRFDTSPDGSAGGTLTKRRKRKDPCEDSRSQRILADCLDTWIDEIVEKYQDKIAALATLQDMKGQEVSERFFDRLKERLLDPAHQSTQPRMLRPTAPAVVEYALQSSSYQSVIEQRVDDPATPIRQPPTDQGRPLAIRPRTKAKLRRDRKIALCRRTEDENLLERDERRRYQCTRKCGKRFSRKDYWKRHELKACPQDGWFCMVDLFDERDGEPLCQICRASCTSAEHFTLSHPDWLQNGTLRGQRLTGCGKLIVSNRKDHFRQHFDSRHPELSATHFEKLENMSRFRIPYEGQWRCGFCPPQCNGFDDWNERCHHVANHFENDGKAIKDWSDYSEWPKAKLQHRESKDDTSSDEDDNNGGEGPSRTNGSLRKDPPDFHSDSSDCSDDDDEPPRGKGSGRQKGSNGISQAGKGTHGAQILRAGSDFDHASATSANSVNHPSKLSTGTKNSTLMNSLKQQLQSSRCAQLQESTVIWRHQEKDKYTKISAPGGGEGQSPFKENKNTDSSPEARLCRAFERIKVLGTGSYSIVEEVLHRPTQLRCARKTSRANQQSQNQHILVELRTLRRLRHQHIVRLLDSFSIGTQFSILLVPVAESNLAEYLEMVTPFTMECRSHLKKFLGCLISAMVYIHESSVTHGDIKPANILITKKPSPNVLLCDFGAARRNTNSTKWTSHGRPLTWKYCAPEVVARQSRGAKADIWSLGCVFLEISIFLYAENSSQLQDFRTYFSGDFFYHKELSTIYDWLNFFQSRATAAESHIPETIRSMLQPKPLQRPSATCLFGRFPPASCCLAEPTTSLRPVSSFDALYDLATIRSVPELANHWYSCPKHTNFSQYVHAAFALGTEALDKICSEFTRLTLAQYRLQASTDGIRSCKTWLQICTVSHLECTTKRTSFTPTRLLEVSFSSKPVIRLRSNADFPGMKPQYVALSYLWGSDNHFLQLGKSLFENRSVDIDKLPPMLVRAISAVNLLGHCYLWVDSLCINQDDIEERYITIRNMAHIYQSADVTLLFGGDESTENARDETLIHSGSSSVQCLESERPESRRHDLAMYRRDVDLISVSLEHEKSRHHSQFCPTCLNSTNSQSIHTIWFTRAWTLQESLLSKRRIVLTDDDVHWECQSLRATSTFPRGLDPYLWESIYGKWEQRIVRCTCQYIQPAPRSNPLPMSKDIALYDFWAVVVTKYTSEASDDCRDQVYAYVGLLPVAKKMKTAIKDNFLVGLWERSLSWSLLWKVDSLCGSGSEELMRKQTKPVFPSWSWAGWTGTVRMPRYTPGRSLITILKVEVTEDESSVLGRLSLRGPVSAAYLIPSADTEIPIFQIALSLSPKAQPNLVHVVGHFDYGPDMALLSSKLFAVWVWLAIPNSMTRPAIGAVLLRKAEEDENNIFRRCGMFELPELPFPVKASLDDNTVDLDFLEGLTREITIL